MMTVVGIFETQMLYYEKSTC